MEIDEKDIQKLIGKINRVTCPFRHNESRPSAVPKDDLIELTNYQIEFEQKYLRD